MSSIEKFWIWSLANSPKFEESFPLYLSKYRKLLESGFKVFDYSIENNQKICILNRNSNQPNSIDNELSNLKVFFNWLAQSNEKFNLYSQNINWQREWQRRLNTKHSSYMSTNINRLSLERIAQKESIISKPKKRIMHTDKAFPYSLFLELIAKAEIREKLLYLLMGGTSARIGQALNLTIYDIDYENKDVYLSDPCSNDPNQYGHLGKPRKNWLLKNYNIDARTHYPHNVLQFKYPIPSRPNKPLFWINKEIKDLFFNVLADYNIVPEHTRIPRHPFFFTLKNGGRLLYRPAAKTFKRYCLLLYKKHQSSTLEDLSLHSLRHMWGNYMAESYYLGLMSNNPTFSVEKIRLYAQYGMGHSNSKSTDIYFNAEINKVIEAGSTYFEHHITEMRNFPSTFFLKGLA